MLVRLLIVALAVVIVSLLLRLNRRFEVAPPWLRISHQVIFYVALAYTIVFIGIFAALHLFGYRL
ncbi:MAG: hypothetical protein AB7F74_12265 [Parvibaculaceae bacterium]